MGANAELVRRAYAAFGRGDIPGVLELLDDDVDWAAPHTLPQGGQFRGRADVGRFFEGVGKAWEELHEDLEAIDEVSPELVAAVVRMSGRRQGGQASGYGAVHVFDVRDGRITRFREYTDLDGPLA